MPLLPAQDFKRVGDNDAGPNTGGMGAYSPLPWLPDEVTAAIVSDVVEPVAAELVRRGCPFSGLLYAGLAITSNGPAVVEFNCRFGDPETQAVLALLDSPLGQVLHATSTGTLAEFGPLQWRDGYAVTVVLAAENYPGRPRVGDVIVGRKPMVCCMLVRPAAATVPWCPPAAGCCPWWEPARIYSRHVSLLMRCCPQSGCRQPLPVRYWPSRRRRPHRGARAVTRSNRRSGR